MHGTVSLKCTTIHPVLIIIIILLLLNRLTPVLPEVKAKGL